jgi:uncharacterized iron-regulated membrane protein
MSWINRWSRKLHRWGAVLIAVPLLLVVCSGLLLQLKKQVPWVQPATMRGSAESPKISLEQILRIATEHPPCQVNSWQDIDRLDIQPGRSIVKVLCKNRWEIQVDLLDGNLLSSAYRRSDLIESLHDGSFFGDTSKLAIFLPSGAILLGLWFSGVYLWFLPIIVKRRKLKKGKRQSSHGTA